MIESLIAGFFGYFSVVMLFAAVVLTALYVWRNGGIPQVGFAEQLLRWVLLLIRRRAGSLHVYLARVLSRLFGGTYRLGGEPISI